MGHTPKRHRILSIRFRITLYLFYFHLNYYINIVRLSRMVLFRILQPSSLRQISKSRAISHAFRPLTVATFSTTARWWQQQSNMQQTSSQPSLGSPLNLPRWLKENSHLLKPPINNYCVYNDAVTVMIVGGPNARTDYHVNDTAEWFYQHSGAMLLKTIQAGRFEDIVIREGDMFLLPPGIPHNPVRFADTVGIVLEQKRPADSTDHLRWYCDGCSNLVHEKSFHCTDLGSQIKEAVQAFDGDSKARTCGNCGVVNASRPTPEQSSDMAKLAGMI